MFEYNDPIRTDPIAAIAHTNCIDFFCFRLHDNNKIIPTTTPFAEFHFLLLSQYKLVFCCASAIALTTREAPLAQSPTATT